MQQEERAHLAQVAGAADIELKKRSAMFYDCEIICMVPTGTELYDPSLFYCKGWDDFGGTHKMVKSPPRPALKSRSYWLKPRWG